MRHSIRNTILKKIVKICQTGGSLVMLAVSPLGAQMVTVNPVEAPGPLTNPLMGFRPGLGNYSRYPYPTVIQQYIPWKTIEYQESDSVQKIRDYCNAQWGSLPANNVKVIPRVYIDWDSNTGNEAWPSDLTTGDWSSQQFKDRVVRLIGRLGEVWNNDPRVAWVQTGIIGYWGEQESPVGLSQDGWGKRMGDAFTAAFPNKKFNGRNMGAFPDSNVGVYWDSFGHPGQRPWAWTDIINFNKQGRYLTQVVEGEVAYNWGIGGEFKDLYGGVWNPTANNGSGDWESSPDITLENAQYTDNMIDVIRELHASALGWISSYSPNNATVRTQAARMQKEFGYRFHITEFSCDARTEPGANLNLQFKVKNKGSAPMYENWPLAVVLIDKNTRQLLWKATIPKVDIRTWHPGADYNKTTRAYQTPAREHLISASIPLPANLPVGEHLIGLSILEPLSRTPGLFFAIPNFFEQSQTQPLCKIGIGMNATGHTLDGIAFDDLVADDTRSYTMTPQDPSYSLTPQSSTQGSISTAPGGSSHRKDSGVEVTATGIAGYAFSSWGGALAGRTDNPAIIVMDADKTISANYVPVVLATGTWSGAFDGTWDTTATNWSDVSGNPWDAINGPGNTATFSTVSLAAVVSGPIYTNDITFSTTGAVSGSTINLVGTTPTVAVATGQTGTISSVIAGSAGLIKSDAGLLTLSNATYTGGTTVNGGRLVLMNTKTGSPNSTTNAELEFNLTTGNQQLIGGTLSGTGKLIKTGGNNLILSDWSGNQTVAFTGADSVIDVQGGTLSNFTAAGAFGPSVNWSGNKAGLTVASGATFDLMNNSVTVDELNGAGTINKDTWDTAPTLTIGVNNGTGTFSGAILNPKNSLAIVKQGTGTQTLSGGNITYKGGTTVSGGRLVLENTLTGKTSYTTHSELEFKLTTGSKQLQGGTFSGTGKLIKTGGNELILSNWGGAQTVALTGADSVIDVQAGKLSNFSASAFGAPHTVWSGNKAGLTVASGATFEMNNTSVIVDELSGGGTINKGTWDTAVMLTIGVNNGSGNFSGVIAQSVGQTLSLVKQGTGTQTLSGINTYNGATTVSAGTLALVGGSQASPITVSAGASLGFTLGSPTTSTSGFDFTAGTIKITGTPDGSSSYALITQSTGIGGTPTLHTPIPGYDLAVDGASLKLVPGGGSDYHTWFLNNGVTGGTADDDDNDGVLNLEEYTFGLLPKNGSSVSPITTQLDEATGTFSYTRRKSSLTTLTYSVWYSTSLEAGSWIKDTGATEGAPTLVGDVETVPLTISTSLLAHQQLFIQVRAE
jgi:autotransporter-associated beta strand protein